MRLVRFLASALAIALMVPAALSAVAAPVQGRAVNYTYTTIDYPGAIITFAFGLNDQSPPQIVGNYFDSSFVRHAFLLADGVFSTIDPPGGTTDNSANNIN